MTRFITLCGKRQTGKDTSAQYIKYVLKGQHVHIVHFADALKEACGVIFGIPLEDMETETGKQRLTDIRWPIEIKVAHKELDTLWKPNRAGENMTIREILQFVGTNLFRNQMDSDIWVKSVYRKRYRDEDIVVVADCRFPNEADFAKKHGVLISIERKTGLAIDNHASETALDNHRDYDYIIDNNGSFMDLHEHLNSILRIEGFLA